MKDITFDNWATFYTIPDEVEQLIMIQKRRINELEDAIKYAKMKQQTAAKKRKKSFGKEADAARNYLYTLVGDKVEQLELHR